MDFVPSNALALEPSQIELVRATWQHAQADLQHISKLIFERIFQLSPDAKSMFSFMKNRRGNPATEEMESNAARAHAASVIHLVGDSLCRLAGIKGVKKVAVKSLRQKDKPGAALTGPSMAEAAAKRVEDMGRRHVTYGVQKEHFALLKEAIMSVLSEQYPTEWTPDVNDAWSLALDYLTNVMIEGMEKSGSKRKAKELPEAEPPSEKKPESPLRLHDTACGAGSCEEPRRDPEPMSALDVLQSGPLMESTARVVGPKSSAASILQSGPLVDRPARVARAGTCAASLLGSCPMMERTPSVSGTRIDASSILESGPLPDRTTRAIGATANAATLLQVPSSSERAAGGSCTGMSAVSLPQPCPSVGGSAKMVATEVDAASILQSRPPAARGLKSVPRKTIAKPKPSIELLGVNQ